MMKLALFCIVLLLMARVLTAEAYLKAAGPGRDFDLQGFIDSEIKAGKKQVVVPPGRYRVTPRRAVHLQFTDLRDVQILADGVEMVCTQTTKAVDFERCVNVRLKGLVIDYDPLPFTEGRIVSMARDKSWLEFELFDGYPENALEMRIEIFDPATGELRRTDASWEPSFQKVGPRRYRVVKRGRLDPAQDIEQLGDILVTNNVYAPGGSAAHAVVSSDCQNVLLEDVCVFASNCFGFLENRCAGMHYLRCHIDRRPPESDFPARGYARMRSLDADAYHSVGATVGPSIVGCSARFQADDCVNIHGTYSMITACDGARVRVLPRRSTIDIAEGDTVEFLPFAGARPADARVLKIDRDPVAVSDPEKAFVNRLLMNPVIKKQLTAPTEPVYWLTLARPVALPEGSLICSGRSVGNGFVVKDCDFGYNRSRGILIKASHGQVIGNRITHSWMASVLVAPEFYWTEAASSSDLVIKDNVIDGCHGTAIDVIAMGGDGKPLPAGAHSNIAILDNKITGSPWPNIEATSTDKLKISGNILTPPDREKTLKSSASTAIVTTNCAEAEIVP